MIIHFYDDDSCGYQYEVGDWVKLNRDIMCSNVLDKIEKIHIRKGAYGQVSDTDFGSSSSWSTKKIRVDHWNEKLKTFIGELVETAYFFEPLYKPFIVRVGTNQK